MHGNESETPANTDDAEAVEDLAPIDADSIKGGFNPQPEPPGRQHQ